jgi:hypothetical protein
MKACGAKTRGGGKCRKAAMTNGRCKLHGGKTPSGPDSVHYKHGRYATVFRGALAEKFLHATEEEKPFDLLPELAVQRAVLSQHIEAISQKSNKPSIDELKSISVLAEDVVRTAATIAKVRNDTAMTVAEIKFIQAGMMRLIEKYVPDPNRRRNFIEELRGLVPGRDDASGTSEPAAVPLLAETTSGAA